MAIFGSSQETDVDIVNQNFNEFTPELVITNTINGLDTLGEFLRNAFENISGSNTSQAASLDQAGINISTAIDSAGNNISQGLLTSSETLSGGITRLGANVGFSIVTGAAILVVGGALLRA